MLGKALILTGVLTLLAAAALVWRANDQLNFDFDFGLDVPPRRFW